MVKIQWIPSDIIPGNGAKDIYQNKRAVVIVLHI